MIEKKRLLVDMDGVLADIYSQYINFESEELGITKSLHHLNGLSETEAFINCSKYIRTKGFFRQAPVIRGSIEGLALLNDKYEVYIVSSATEFPNSLEEKHDWLNEHFQFISWKQMVFCGTKKIINGDIMVDDHPVNLNFFEGKKIIFSQPHNAYVENSGFIRVANWSELIKIL